MRNRRLAPMLSVCWLLALVLSTSASLSLPDALHAYDFMGDPCTVDSTGRWTGDYFLQGDLIQVDPRFLLVAALSAVGCIVLLSYRRFMIAVLLLTSAFGAVIASKAAVVYGSLFTLAAASGLSSLLLLGLLRYKAALRALVATLGCSVLFLFSVEGREDSICFDRDIEDHGLDARALGILSKRKGLTEEDRARWRRGEQPGPAVDAAE